MANTMTSSALTGRKWFRIIVVWAITNVTAASAVCDYGVVTAAVAGFLLLNSLIKARVMSMLSAA
jgi:hypothetical protein